VTPSPMSPASKVVQLNTDAARTLPPVLQSLRNATQKRLRELLQELFNNADDALFEMADRSRNDADQNLFFDSMRQLRLHRSRILTDFYNIFSRNFDSLYDISKASNKFSSEPDAAAEGELSLLQNDELEMSVAISGIVSKVTSQFSLQLSQLTQRLDTLCRHTGIAERNNPLGPYRLATAFVDATSEVDIPIKVRIILLKQFERFVMERMGSCYDLANRILAEAGVLADLRSVRRPQTPGAASSQARAAQTAPANTSADVRVAATEIATEFAVLQELLASARRPGALGASGAHTGGVTAPGAVCSTPELIALLRAVQTDHVAEPIDLDAVPSSIDLPSVLAARTTGRDGHASFGRSDEDAVNLIGMLFDYILNDRNLAIPMKALIGRLQIPMLKVAILDKAFFSKPSHPARQLLNELSSAGIGWSSSAELKRDALYDKIESIVVRVLNHFDDDFQLFEALVSELRDFVQQDGRRIAKIEQRMRETELGKAKTVAAKRAVQQLINEKASGLRLPPTVSRFISETWSRVLVLVNVKHGPEHDDWTNATQALDDLLWCVQPLELERDLDKRDRMIPVLLSRLTNGMQSINLPANELTQALATLRDTLTDIAEHDRAYLADATGTAHGEEVQRNPMTEIVLAAPDDAEDVPEHAPAPEMVTRINGISEGVWVEFRDDGGERTRCKVAAIVQPGNRYIFVNRRGMKVRELTRMALAVEIENGTLTVLDESQVFDRALEAVIGNLRQMRNAPPR
jgi:hypothetical protein